MSDPYVWQKLACAMLGMGHGLIISGILNIYNASRRNSDVVRDFGVAGGVGALGAFSLVYLLGQVEIK
jgi:hypothetical protein